MEAYKEHIIKKGIDARSSLQALDDLPPHSRRILFLTDDNDKLLGTLTDGDIRRGLLEGHEISEPAQNFVNLSFRSLVEGQEDFEKIKQYREDAIFMVPVIDKNGNLKEILDLSKTKAVLPMSAVIMAGGRGERLRPLTDSTPKPMLHVGEKPIIERNIDRLIECGVKEIFITVKYLKEQIMEYFGDGSSKGVSIKYFAEEEPLGTLGSLAMIDQPSNEDVLVMNSDLLTNIDFVDFYSFYKESEADMILASIPYVVDVPYAVLDTNRDDVAAFSEKPSYTYYSNGGIYLLKYGLSDQITKGQHYNATDLMDHIIATEGKTLKHYPLLGYWLDIGKHQDFMKAQEDIKRIHF